MTVVVDAEQMKALSGCKQKSSVARWCRKNKIRFLLDAQGWPVTTSEALNQALSLGGPAEPDWSACDMNADPKSTHWRHKRRSKPSVTK